MKRGNGWAKRGQVFVVVVALAVEAAVVVDAMIVVARGWLACARGSPHKSAHTQLRSMADVFFFTRFVVLMIWPGACFFSVRAANVPRPERRVL